MRADKYHLVWMMLKVFYMIRLLVSKSILISFQKLVIKNISAKGHPLKLLKKKKNPSKFKQNQKLNKSLKLNKKMQKLIKNMKQKLIKNIKQKKILKLSRNINLTKKHFQKNQISKYGWININLIMKMW